MATSDVAGSSPLREERGSKKAVARRKSSRLYRELIDGEIASDPPAWDVRVGDSPVRLLSIRYLGVLSPESGQTILTDYLHRASKLQILQPPPPSPTEKGSTWPKKSKKKKFGLSSVSSSTSGKKSKTKARGSSTSSATAAAMENGNASGVGPAEGAPPIPAAAVPGKMEGTAGEEAPASLHHQQPQDNGIPPQVDGVAQEQLVNSTGK